MKISEQTSIGSIQQNPKNQMQDHEFEHWITTPTKQNTGDEFYWQHQDQLQKSSLEFERRSLSNLHTRTGVCMEKQSIINDSKDVSAYSESETQITEQSETRYTTNPGGNSSCLKSIMDELIKELSQVQLPISGDSLTPNYRVRNTLNSNETKSFEQLLSKGSLKKFHLFIQHDEAEMSINTQELNQEEQLELIAMIKLNLKHKGLSLRQLIINGVKK